MGDQEAVACVMSTERCHFMKKLTCALLWLLIISQLSSAQYLQAVTPQAAGTCEQRVDRMYRWLQDWPNLSRFREANAKLPPPAAGESRVVFMGDSITEGWNLEQYFPHKPYVNRGISGQTTAQMLLRFRQDVVALKPRAVVILAGTNDIAGNTGPASLDDIEANLVSMIDIARADGIQVVLASVLPVNNYTENAGPFFIERPPERILALNRWLLDYAQKNALTYTDYFSHMIDERGLLRRELADDGLHPNAAGYKLMAPLTDAAIAQALKAAR